MDCRPDYIEMCEKAEEIQAKWYPQPGDIFADKNYSGFSDSLHIYLDNIPTWGKGLDRHYIVDMAGIRKPQREFRKDQYIWLPRQDQLQEMVWTHTEGTYNLLATKLFAFLDYWREHGVPISFTSMEQLWLCFTMHELYHKEWVNGGWREESGQK